MSAIQFFFFLVFLTTGAFAQPLTFQKHIGGSADEALYAGAATTDGGMVLAANTNSFGAGSYDIYLIKLDSTGHVQWQKTYGSLKSDVPDAIAQTTDHGYIVLGSTIRSTGLWSEIYVIRVDSLGDLLWSKTYGNTTGGSFGTSVKQMDDGGFMLGGQAPPPLTGLAYLVKIDSIGAIEWTRTYSGSRGLCAALPTKDGGYLLTGNSYVSTTSTYIYVTKVDSTGNLLWSKTLAGSGSHVQPFAAMETPEGDFLITGSNLGVANDAFLLKLDSAGSVRWAKRYVAPGVDIFMAISIAGNGNYLLTGESSSMGANNDLLFTVTDTAGNILLNKAYGTTPLETGKFAREVPGGYLLAGYSHNVFSGPPWNIYIIKTNENAESGCNEVGGNFSVIPETLTESLFSPQVGSIDSSRTVATVVSDAQGLVTTLCSSVGVNEISPARFAVYPNPATDQLTVETQHRIEAIAVYDAFGRKCSLPMECRAKRAVIDVRNLSKGAYFLSCTSKGVISSKMFVKE